jgi:hypothetical protein
MSSSPTSRDSAINREQDGSTTAESHPCNEALISRQRQRYLASLPSDGEAQSDNQYREQ